MATKGIADLGNGLGYLYKTKLISGDIVSVERNTPQGVQAMQQMGVTNAPISAQRSAYATITVINSGGTGSITNIDINGVNQIGAPIVVTSTNTQTVATQIVNAINAYSAPGFAFTANKPFSSFAIVYVYSAPQDGSIINGLTPSVSATDPGLLFLTNPFINGSNDNGVFDDQFGYEFFMYADPAATPTVVPVGSYNITRFITLRGSNTGIITLNRNLSPGGAVLGLTRSCDTTQIILDTGGPVTANCGFIETVDFVEGDIIRLRNSTPSRVTTMQDASVSTSSTPNLYLTNQAPFTLSDYNSITLQYRYDPILGPIWVETGRSITNYPVSTTLAVFLAQAAAGTLQPGTRYFITDLSTGVYVYAIDNVNYEQNGVLRRYIPINYTGCWRSNMAAPLVNQIFRYNQRNYKSLTGVVGTAPDTDAVNWQLLPYSTAGSYTERFHSVLLNERSLMLNWPIIQEEDGNGNCVIQSYDHFQATSVNAFDVFCWNIAQTGRNYAGNYVCDAIFDVANSDGNVFQNTVTSGTVFNNNILDASSIVSRNTFINGSIITGNNFRTLSGNYVDGGLMQNNASGANKAPNINSNTLIKGYIIGNYSTGTNSFIDSNSLSAGSSILNCVFNNVGYVSLNTLNTVSAIQNCVFLKSVGPAGHITANNMSDTTVTLVQSTAADNSVLRQSTFKSATIVFNSNAGSLAVVDSFFDQCTFSNCVEFGADKCTFTNCDVPNQIDCIFLNSTITGWTQIAAFNHLLLGVFTANVIAGVSSNKYYDLYIDDPAIFSANILTIPYAMSLGGEFRIADLSTTGAITVDEVVDLPDFQKVIFYNVSNGSTTPTFNKVSPGAWVPGNTIVGAANFTLNGNVTGVSDYMTMARYQGVVNMITGGVNFV